MKRYFSAIVFSVFASLLFSSFSHAAVSVTPSSVNAVRGQSNTVVLTYQFSGYIIGSGTLTSNQGIFFTPDIIIGYNNLPLTVTINNARGTVTETVVIPVGVMERALERGTAQFSYRRVFTGFIGTDTATVNVTVTGEAGGTFGIRRIALYFENGRSEITVPKNMTGLKAYADIRYNGAGLFKGYWEVDGRLLSYVSKPLSGGQKITLETPDIPSLPTFEAGTHSLRFVVTEPSAGQALAPPALIYFVTTEEAGANPREVVLKSPPENQEVPYAPVKCEWQSLRAPLYLVEFFEKQGAKPVFSAYTKKNFYLLPQLVLKKNFEPGKTYFWKVTGLDRERRKVGESRTGSFHFASAAAEAGK